MTGPAIPSRMTARDAQPVQSLFQDLDARMAHINAFGEQKQQAFEPSQSEMDAMQAANVIFSTPEGAVLLEWFADNTVRQPFVADPTVDPARGWAMAQRRQGLCDAFFTLLALIAAAREDPADTRDQASS